MRPKLSAQLDNHSIDRKGSGTIESKHNYWDRGLDPNEFEQILEECKEDEASNTPSKKFRQKSLEPRTRTPFLSSEILEASLNEL